MLSTAVFYLCLASVLDLGVMGLEPFPMPPYGKPVGRLSPFDMPPYESGDNQSAAVLFKDLPSEERIVGGSPTSKNQVPWQAFVYVGSSFCGGSIVHPNFVFTAGHCCTTSTGQVEVASNFKVGLGAGTVGAGGFPAGGTIYNVAQVIRHPSYRLSAVGYPSYDFCLLKLSSTVAFSTAVQPIGIPMYSSQCAAGTAVTASGWGLTSNSGTTISNTLNYLNMTIQACNSFAAFPAGEATDTMLCTGTTAGATNGKSVCRGDSGGPLYAYYNSRPVLCGVSSFVTAGCCGCQGYPSGFGSVYTMQLWFAQVIGSGYSYVF